MCYLNNHSSTTSENKCRYDLDEFLHQISSTNHQSMPPSVVFSHVPLDHLSPVSQTANVKSRILSSLVGTNFIFSGHIHHMMYSSHNLKTYTSPSPLSVHRGLDHELPPAELTNVRHTTYEITVPTCSYRMGERHMGVGAALLSKFKFWELGFTLNFRFHFLYGMFKVGGWFDTIDVGFLVHVIIANLCT